MTVCVSPQRRLWTSSLVLNDSVISEEEEEKAVTAVAQRDIRCNDVQQYPIPSIPRCLPRDRGAWTD